GWPGSKMTLHGFSAPGGPGLGRRAIGGPARAAAPERPLRAHPVLRPALSLLRLLGRREGSRARALLPRRARDRAGRAAARDAAAHSLGGGRDADGALVGRARAARPAAGAGVRPLARARDDDRGEPGDARAEEARDPARHGREPRLARGAVVLAAEARA